jgi:hypothetical protein
VAEHSADDHPDDRVHQSTSRRFGVVTMRTAFSDEGVVRTPVAAQYELVLFQPHLDPEPWLHLGDEEERGIDLSVESARRLAAEIARFQTDQD